MARSMSIIVWLRPRAWAESGWCSDGCSIFGELNTTQIDRWQRSIEVIEEDGRACQRRLFSDRGGQAPQQEEDVCEVVLSSLLVRRPRILGDCWLGCRLWEELGPG